MSPFEKLLKLLEDYGVEIGKMIYTSSHENNMYHLLGYLYLDDKKIYSCFNTGAFITALFVDDYMLDYDSDGGKIIQQFPCYKTAVDFDRLFKPGTFTRIIVNSHDFSVVYLNDDEIYMIDYYSETERDKFFRVKKFKYNEIYMLILTALFSEDRGPYAYKMLFDFKNNSYMSDYIDKETDSIRAMPGVEFYVFKLTTLPTIEKIEILWDISEKMFVRQYTENLKKVNNNTFKILWFIETSEKQKKVLPRDMWYDESVTGYGYLFNATDDSKIKENLQTYNSLLLEKYKFSVNEIVTYMRYNKHNILAAYNDY